MSLTVSIFRLIRVQNCLVASAGVLLGAHMTPYVGSYYRPMVVAIAAFFACAFGNALNDILDVESDRINHPQRVLVRGDISAGAARAVMYLCGCAAVLVGYLTDWLLMGILLVTMGALVYYNFRGKHQVLIGNLIVAILGGLVFLAGGMAVDISSAVSLPGPLIPAALAMAFHVTREVIKDIQDRAGDKSITSGTLPIRFGLRGALRVAMVLYLITCVIALWPWAAGWYSLWYGLISVIGVLIPTGAVMLIMVNNPTQRHISRAAHVFKVGMVVGVAALLLA